MVHPKGLTDKAVTDILLNSDSEEDFGIDNNNELRVNVSVKVKVTWVQETNSQWVV
jgi:hypothetical protein